MNENNKTIEEKTELVDGEKSSIEQSLGVCEEVKKTNEKPLSLPVRFYKNLSFYLKFTISPFVLALFSALCIYAVMFFNGRMLIYKEIGNSSLRQSSALMLLVFSFFLIIFGVLLFLSIYLNIKKHLKKRSK